MRRITLSSSDLLSTHTGAVPGSLPIRLHRLYNWKQERDCWWKATTDRRKSGWPRLLTYSRKVYWFQWLWTWTCSNKPNIIVWKRRSWNEGWVFIFWKFRHLYKISRINEQTRLLENSISYEICQTGISILCNWRRVAI